MHYNHSHNQTNKSSHIDQPKSTVDNSDQWKIWHGFNYIVGGITFLIGSILLFPFFNDYLNAAKLSAWLYTIGSTTFLLADITEFLHFVTNDCRYLKYVINFFVSVTGSFLYLVGSICFIPEVNKADWGMTIFIIGSFVIVIGQLWKLMRTFTGSNKLIHEIYK